MKFFLKNWFKIVFLAVFLLACFWRFVNFRERLVFNQDQARDATIAFYSIQEHRLPLIGPPSSAGLFSFGPLYYWIIILFEILLPFSRLGPWIGFAILSLGNVLIFWKLGHFLEGKKFAAWLGLLAAVTTSEVAGSGEMLNTVLVASATVLSFYFLARLLREGRPVFAFSLGLAIGLAINAHFQAAGLLPILILFVAMGGFPLMRKLKLFVVSSLGVALTFLPVLIFNFQHHGLWLERVVEYFLVGQKKFNVIITWGSEISDFWPKLWGQSLFGRPSLGGFLAIFVLTAFVLVLVNRQQKALSSRFFFIILFSFLIQAVMLRYYRGPRSWEYLNIFRPYLFYLAVWSIWKLKEKAKLLGKCLFILFFALMFLSDLKVISQKGQSAKIFRLKSSLDRELKGDKIRFYNFPQSDMVSLPLFYLFYREGRVSANGNKIGACQFNWVFDESTSERIKSCPFIDQVVGEEDQYLVYLFKSTAETNLLSKSKELTAGGIYLWLTAYYQKI